MELHVGDFVVCEDWIRGETNDEVYYGRIVPPDNKHEVRQCRHANHVIVETIRGVYLRLVTDRNTVFRRLSEDEFYRLLRVGLPTRLPDVDLALRHTLS